MGGSLRSVLTVLLVVAVVVGGFPAFGPTAAAQSTGDAPNGFVGVPTDNVESDLPPRTPMGEAAQAIADAGVYASDDAGTLDVIVTNPGRAKNKYSGGNLNGGGPVAIVFADDEVHEGREVAVSADVVEDAIGYKPEVVFGAHEDGSDWTREIRYENGRAIFEIPHFSENTVTFSGGIGLDGSSASDGTQYQYELDSLDGVSNFGIDLTGVENTDQKSVSQSVTSGDTMGLDVGGTENPTNAEISWEKPPDESYLNDGEADATSGEATQYVNTEGSNINEVDADFYLSNGNDNYVDYEAELYTAPGDVGSDVFTEGDYIGSVSGSSWLRQVGISGPVNYDNAGGVTFGLKVLDGTEAETVELTNSEAIGSYENNLVAETSDGETVDISGSSGTEPINLTQSTSGISFSGSGSANVDLSFTERSHTVDPTVEVNGYETTHDGTLAEGETVSVPTQEAWISEGTNRVNISTSSPSSGPGSLVDMSYSHEASSVSTAASVNATTWRERVEVSNTFPSNQTDATARITFSEETVGIVDVEKRINSNDSADWTPLHESEYSWSSNDSALVVELGDVSADTDVELRATGSKVDVVDGEIDVVSPTIEGDTLDSRIEVVSAGEDGVGIEVTGTAPDPLIHYLHDPSYSEEAYAEVSPSGSQTLRLPAAFEGASTNVRTAPIEVNPSSAPVRVTIVDRDEPRFAFEHTSEGAPGDVEVTYHEALPDETYQLYSVARELNDGDKVEVEDGSVTLVSSGWEGSYLIELAEMSSGVINATGGDGGSSGGAVLSILAVLFGTALPIVGTFFVGRRFGVGRSSTRLLVGLVAVSGTLLALELAGGRLVTQALFVFSDVSGLAIAGAVESGVATVVVGLVLLLGMWVVNLRTSQEIPRWLMGLSTVLVVIWMLEAISGGVLTGGLDEVAPVMWLIGGGGGFVLLFLWIRAKGEPDAVISVEGVTK